MTTDQLTDSETACETAVVFGDHSRLVGVYARPGHYHCSDDFAVLMITAGMLSSCGPYRLHAMLAQSLQRDGMASFRFDLSGIGDSLAAGFEGTSLERAAHEISSAIDFLHDEYGINRVAVFGLCSGADDALFAATKDSRVVGLFCIDGLAYRTRKFALNRLMKNYLPKLTCKRAWRDRLAKLFQVQVPVHESLQMGLDVREFPDRETAAEQLLCLVERGVDMHFHYTGGFGEVYNYERQFHDMFKVTVLGKKTALSRLTTSFSPESDHVAFLVEHRERLVEFATDRIGAMSKQRTF